MTRSVLVGLLLGVLALGQAGEKAIVSLRDFSTTELKSAGFVLSQPTELHVIARGAGGSTCDRDRKGRDDLFAYGWILDAVRREVVWMMDREATTKARDDRTFDGRMTLPQGSYEVYFTAPTFSYLSTFKNISLNVDHRERGLFNIGVYAGTGSKGWLERLLEKFFGDDMRDDWAKRSPNWGIDILVDDGAAGDVTLFTPPKAFSNVLFKATGVGENAHIHQSFTISETMTIRIYALGEGLQGEYELADYGWIVNAQDRSRVWEMSWKNSQHAGGASKNLKFSGEVVLPRGTYTLYYVTDNSHSATDWNCAPPADPLQYGITLHAVSAAEKGRFILRNDSEEGYAIVRLTRMRDNESRAEGFTLKKDAQVRIYAIGERSNERRLMADYGVILDARTRTKVWTMDVDRTRHAGGASKNRMIDEIITLPKGSYIVQYVTDDSHAYGTWNADPPYDSEHYGITVYGAGETFDRSVVGTYTDERDKHALAQLIRVGSSEQKQARFSLDKTTRIRIYALGEGVGRSMVDYGWITDNRTGTTVWEMTYSMTAHAGGARKNRLVNTTIILEKGSYTVHYVTDDSHAFRDWNSDPPEDAEYWGITLYRDDSPAPPTAPPPPSPPPKP